MAVADATVTLDAVAELPSTPVLLRLWPLAGFPWPVQILKDYLRFSYVRWKMRYIYIERECTGVALKLLWCRSNSNWSNSIGCIVAEWLWNDSSVIKMKILDKLATFWMKKKWNEIKSCQSTHEPPLTESQCNCSATNQIRTMAMTRKN